MSEERMINAGKVVGALRGSIGGITENFSDNQTKIETVEIDGEQIPTSVRRREGEWTIVSPNPAIELIVDAKGVEKWVRKGKYGRGRPPLDRTPTGFSVRNLNECSRRSRVNDIYCFWAERALSETGEGYESRFEFLLGRSLLHGRNWTLWGERRPGQKRTILYELGRLIVAGYRDEAIEWADEICKQRASTTGVLPWLRATRMDLTGAGVVDPEGDGAS